MEAIWKKEFPIIDKFIELLKAPDYCLLAHLLQRQESKVVIGDLCDEVELLLDVSYFTVHDSIFVKNSKVDVVRPIFEQVLRNHKIVSGLVVG